ncbi:MAG: SDR family NAD(P)-dependent oxidoreductase, partial [Ahrensia sp.]
QSDQTALRGLSGDLDVLEFDVADEGAVNRAGRTFQQKLDIIVNNAGIIGPERQATTDMDYDGFARTLAVNTLGPLIVTNAFLPNLRQSKAGKLVTISSQMGMMTSTSSDRIAYRASKSAVNKVMQGLATDLRAANIAVLTLHPGWVRSDMGGSSADISTQESAAGILQRINELSIETTGQFLNYAGETMAW